MESCSYKRDIFLLVLCITRECNMSCEYCYMNGRKEYMSEHTIAQAIEFGFKEAKVLQVQITGGEPFLYFSGIKMIVEVLKRTGEQFIAQVQTNGTVMSPEIVEFIKGEHLAVGTSFDGLSTCPEQLTGKHSNAEYHAKSVIRSLQIFAENGIKTGITCVVTSKNVDFIPRLIDFVYPLGSVNSLHFSVVRKVGMAKDKSYLLPDMGLYEKQLKSLVTKWKEYSKWGGYIGPKVEIRFIENLKQNMVKPASFQKCHVITRTGCYVEPNGDLYPCASLSGAPDFFLGSVENGIDEERYVSIEAKFGDVVKKCRRCDDLHLCGGACLARAFYNNRHPFYECIECKTAKEIDFENARICR